jgi:hypothetical protein
VSASARCALSGSGLPRLCGVGSGCLEEAVMSSGRRVGWRRVLVGAAVLSVVVGGLPAGAEMTGPPRLNLADEGDVGLGGVASAAGCGW